jgi:pilus assembly protein CpaE
VTGVKGGVGASSIAHNLAWALTERCKVNATLVDLDLNFGTTGLDFNQDSTATIADALMSPDRFDDAVMSRLITRATDRLSLFTAPATLDRTYNLDPETYSRVLDQVRRSVPFMLLDLPHIWTDWFKTTVISADDLIIVACPDLASLRNGKNLVDFLKAARPNDNPPKLILNMVGLPKRPEIPPKDFGQAIGLEPVLVLPFDAQLFGTAANNGQMVFDVAPESKIAMSLDQLASTITGKEVKTSKPSMLKKLLGR